MRFNIDVKDVLFIDEIYSSYNAEVPLADALGDYVQNVLDPKYDTYHPLYAVMTFDATRLTRFNGFASDIGSVCAPNEIDIVQEEYGKGFRTCIVEYSANNSALVWPPLINDANTEYTAGVSNFKY